MPPLASEGKVKIWKVPTIADITAPTVAEIEAGTHLTPLLPTSGVDISWTQNNATLEMLDDSFIISAIGTEGAEIILTGLRDDDSDDFWDAFTRGENFNLVVGRFGSASVAGDKVEVYPSQSHGPMPMNPASNEFQTAQVKLAVPSTPERNAVVAA